MLNPFKKMISAYSRFVEQQGFPIIVTICVAVITATAVWTNRQEDIWVAPTPPPAADQSVAQLIQQSLRQVSTPEPVKLAEPIPWTQPLEKSTVLQGFSMEEMIRSEMTGIWRVHDAVDLQADPGSKVHAIRDGVVLENGVDHLHGAWLLVDHGDGYQALYAALASVGAFIAGDLMQAGDVIGFVGNNMIEERHLSPHLHLQVTKDGVPVDPVLLWTAGS